MSVSTRGMRRRLFAQAEPLDQAAVLVRVLVPQVVEQLASLAYELQQPASRVEVLHVGLEVLGEAVDALGKERHLHFGRAGVLAGTLILADDLRLLRDLQCHANVSLSLWMPIFEPAILTDVSIRSQGFSLFISRLRKPEGAQLAFGKRVSEADHGAVGAVERTHASLQSADFQ